MSEKLFAQCILSQPSAEDPRCMVVDVAWLEINEVLNKSIPYVTLKDTKEIWKVEKVCTPYIMESEYRKLIKVQRKTKKGLQSINS